jgi:hypothetical protein
MRSTHCTTTSERRRLSLDALPKGWLTLLSVMMLALFLSLPSLACAGAAYSDELRLLDLELEILSLKSQMLFALTSRDRCTAPRSHT